MNVTTPCRCGATIPYPECCGRLIDDGVRAETCEQLMRSRYCAFALAREAYLLNTWHPSTRPVSLNLDTAAPVQWLGLQVIRASRCGTADTDGVVEFVARYKVNGRAGRLHEVSRFVREQGQWFYVDGRVTDAKRNPQAKNPA